MRFYDYSPEKLAEYKCHIKKAKERTPDLHEPSEAARECLPYAMGLRYYKGAINMAAELGDTKLCEYIYKENQIYKKHPDVINARYGEGKWTPLMNAVARKRLGTAEWLLQHGAKILPNKSGWNPVLWACRDGCIPALNMFKHHGVDFNQPYPRWQWKKGLPRRHLYYPIEIALLANQAKAVQWLFNNGVRVDDKSKKGCSIREMFLENPAYFTQEMRQILIEKIADESQQVNQSTPKHPKKCSFWQRLCIGRTKE